jgi:hypothetical protein
LLERLDLLDLLDLLELLELLHADRADDSTDRADLHHWPGCFSRRPERALSLVHRSRRRGQKNKDFGGVDREERCTGA